MYNILENDYFSKILICFAIEHTFTSIYDGYFDVKNLINK